MIPKWEKLEGTGETIGACKNCGEGLIIELGMVVHDRDKWDLYDNGYWCSKSKEDFAELDKENTRDNTIHSVQDMAGDHYAIWNDNEVVMETSAHCLACAKTEFMEETGKLVDIRGWHFQGQCGNMAKATHQALLQEREKNE